VEYGIPFYNFCPLNEYDSFQLDRIGLNEHNQSTLFTPMHFSLEFSKLQSLFYFLQHNKLNEESLIYQSVILRHFLHFEPTKQTIQ